jgi:crotonobetainyl-CoA:carnitine CoA-transferase CaiB-like acyl-CoA transferase
LRFSKTPVNDKVAPPMLGEHTREVLARVLGLDEAELDALEAGGAVQSRKG